MGQGERQMRNWGYAASAIGILVGLLAIICSSFVLAMHYDTIKLQMSAYFAYVAMAVIAVSAASFLFHYFAIARIQGADDVYTEATYKANHAAPTQAAAAAPVGTDDFFN